ncbi:MAG: hypothetical protein ABI361_00345 [Nitrososphaera sp.]
MSDEQAPLFQYSVKIERSAKGARHTVHVYSNDKETALKESVELYDRIAKELESQGLTVAPIESKGGAAA